MKFFATAFALQVRRLLRRPSTVFCLLLLPLMVILLGFFLPADAARPVQVGVLLPAGSSYAQQMQQGLAAYSDDDLDFTFANDQKQLEEMVAAGVWECGYIAAPELDSRIETGRYARLITRVDSPQSTMGDLLDWSLSAALMEVCAPRIAEQYMEEAAILPAEEREVYAALAEEAFHTENFMRVEIVPMGGQSVQAQSMVHQNTAAIVRGAVALLLMLFGLMCSVWFAGDRRTGFFARMGTYRATAALYFPSWAAAGALGLLAGTVCLGLGGLFFGGYFLAPLREIGLLFAYMLLLAGWCWVLSVLLPGPDMLVCVAPFLVVAGLLFSPIIVNLASYIPGGAVVASLLPPTWYMRGAAGYSGAVWGMVCGGFLLAALGAMLERLLRRRKPPIL